MNERDCPVAFLRKGWSDKIPILMIMASASTSPVSTSSCDLKFLGPAAEEFGSLTEQAIFFLNTYWPNWNNYENPQSYIIPPVFSYKLNKISDEDFSDALQQKCAKAPEVKGGNEAIVKHRVSDTAEHMVFDAIFQLIQEKVEAPFIALHNLDLDKIEALLRQIFPMIDWHNYKTCLREYDYVLIGPKIGIMVIEVKSQKFSRKDFESRTALPPQYVHGIKQLNSINSFLSALAEYPGNDAAKLARVRKILFTPNLEKKRFVDWEKKLNDTDKQQVRGHINGVIQWFKEDVTNSNDDSKKPPLYTMLKRELESGSEVSKEIYESIGLSMAALASIIERPSSKPLPKKLKLDSVNGPVAVASTGQSTSNKFCSITLDPIKLSEEESILKEYKDLDKLSSIPILKECSDLDKLSSILFLTPEQQEALNGPNRQFIIGAAGTGKTIVLQAKALQLLRRGESVLVLSTENYMERYKELFHHYGFTNYEVRCWNEDRVLQGMSFSLIKNITKACMNRSMVGAIYSFVKQQSNECDFETWSNCDYETWLKGYFMRGSIYRHILIDDGFDDTGEV